MFSTTHQGSQKCPFSIPPALIPMTGWLAWLRSLPFVTLDIAAQVLPLLFSPTLASCSDLPLCTMAHELDSVTFNAYL